MSNGIISPFCYKEGQIIVPGLVTQDQEHLISSDSKDHVLKHARG